ARTEAAIASSGPREPLIEATSLAEAAIRIGRARAERTPLALDGLNGLLDQERIDSLDRDNLDRFRCVLGGRIQLSDKLLDVVVHCLTAGQDQAVGAIVHAYREGHLSGRTIPIPTTAASSEAAA